MLMPKPTNLLFSNLGKTIEVDFVEVEPGKPLEAYVINRETFQLDRVFFDSIQTPAEWYSKAINKHLATTG